jgi:hypothetical protein
MSDNAIERSEGPAATKRAPRGVRPASEVLKDREPPRERPNRPVRVIRIGRIRAAIWVNQTDNGPVYNTTFERLYKPDGEDQWKSSESFGTNDLLLLAKVADMAHTWIHQHRGPIDSY